MYTVMETADMFYDSKTANYFAQRPWDVYQILTLLCVHKGQKNKGFISADSP